MLLAYFRQQRSECGKPSCEMRPAVRLQGQDGRSARPQRRVQYSTEIDRSLADGKMVVPLTPVVVQVEFPEVLAESLQPPVCGQGGKKGRMPGIEAESDAFRAERRPEPEKVVRHLVENIFQEDVDAGFLRRIYDGVEGTEGVPEPLVGVEVVEPPVVPAVDHDPQGAEDRCKGDGLAQAANRQTAGLLIAAVYFFANRVKPEGDVVVPVRRAGAGRGRGRA